MSRIILGISAYYHDSAVAIVRDGEVLAAAQEERFSRLKNDAAFPTNAIEYCLSEAGVDISDLDAVVFYEKPFLKFERLLETYQAFAPVGLPSFVKAMPVWLREKLFLKRELRKGLEVIGGKAAKDIKLLFPEHHLSHAASAFYPSPFTESAILTIDGVGEWATASIAHGSGKDIRLLREMRFPHSLGLLYSAFTYFLGFKVNSGEYKVMGLAPYGDPTSLRTAQFKEIISSKLCQLADDGSIWLEQQYFSYATSLRMVKAKKWEKLFGLPQREAESELTQPYADLALALQQFTEEVVLGMATEAKRLTGSENICLAGGVALNCVANGKLEKTELFKNHFYQPAAGDAGGALGAALAAHHIYFKEERRPTTPDAMKGGYLGPDLGSEDCAAVASQHQGKKHFIHEEAQLVETVAELLSKGKVIGWIQGRMEFGPRALGNRSILADPRHEGMQEKLNLKIKFRESFRPFAPAVLAEEAGHYFELRAPSPYMQNVQQMQPEWLQPWPEDYHSLPPRQKLAVQRSPFQAITHVDGSARIQTVHKETNPRFHALLSAFKAKTGHGMLINTSFNVRSEPIVCTPEDAYLCFAKTDMDVLVLGNHILYK